MAKGRIVHWKSDRGFGFVRPQNGGQDVFLHISDVRHAGYEPQVGDDVSYSVKQDGQGRRRAAGAVIDGVPRTRREWIDVVAVLIPVGFFFNLSILDGYRLALIPYFGVSIVTVLLYAADKRRAVTGEWRVSEANLQLLGLMGGWPGAILAQLLFRHKTRKVSFQLFFWGIVAAHVGFWTWLSVVGMSPEELREHFLAVASWLTR
ncbi:MAG: cold shock and DUF1294 domain-containing protein [Rhodospirillales bacterium]|nr:MAG: cold shock and DUF1294 domain-containing protein [Rhodospirillales bacterium]